MTESENVGITQRMREEWRGMAQAAEAACAGRPSTEMRPYVVVMRLLDTLEATEKALEAAEKALQDALDRTVDVEADLARAEAARDALARELDECPPGVQPCPLEKGKEPTKDECIECRMKWAAERGEAG